MIKKAMIMAAGVGSRLEPLSSVYPKPLVPIANVAVMDILVNHLISFGIKDIIANTYYKAQDIQNHYKNSNFDIKINFIEEKELSGTAGGLKKCQSFFNYDDDFIVMSGDGLTDIDIFKAYESHKKSEAMITIVTKEVEHSEVSKYGIIVTDNNNFVSNFQEKPSLDVAKSDLANTGIYIFNYKIFEYIPENTFFDFAKNVFPLVLDENIKINTYKHNGYWSDIGSLNQYIQSNFDILNNKIKYFNPDIKRSENGIYIVGKNSYVSDDVKFYGYSIIGDNCNIGSGNVIKDSIIWNEVETKENITIENSIIMSKTKLTESVYGKVSELTHSQDKEEIKI